MQLLTLASLSPLAACALAQGNDTLAKVKVASQHDGVRDSSGAFSYSLDDGKYMSYLPKICQRIVFNDEKGKGKTGAEAHPRAFTKPHSCGRVRISQSQRRRSALAKHANLKNPADLKIIGEVLNVEPITIMFREDEPAFKKLEEEAITGGFNLVEKLYRLCYLILFSNISCGFQF